MRIAISLADALADLLNKAKRTGLSLERAAHHHLRLVLLAKKQNKTAPFAVKPRPLGLPDGLSYDNVGELLDILEIGSAKLD